MLLMFRDRMSPADVAAAMRAVHLAQARCYFVMARHVNAEVCEENTRELAVATLRDMAMHCGTAPIQDAAIRCLTGRGYDPVPHGKGPDHEPPRAA